MTFFCMVFGFVIPVKTGIQGVNSSWNPERKCNLDARSGRA